MSDAAGAVPSAAGPGGAQVSADESRRGLGYGASAYLLWGAMPVYFLLLLPSSPWEILAHRILWTLVVCVVVLVVRRELRRSARPLRRPRLWPPVVLAGLLITVNWVTYITAATTGHVTDAALGYFLNPLVSVALGLLVLGERLRRLQWVAVGIGGSGAAYLMLATGASWMALVLAFSFGTYGLVKKQMGGTLGPVEGLAAETTVLAPFAAVFLIWFTMAGRDTFGSAGPGHALALASTGIVTAVPLTLFAAAAQRLPLVTIGLLQFLAPVLQFISGLLLGEHMSPERWAGFAVVWVALVVLAVDMVRIGLHARRRIRGR